MSSKQMKFDNRSPAGVPGRRREDDRAVSVTMGPGGRNVVMQKSYGGPACLQGRRLGLESEVELPSVLREHGRADGSPGRQEDGGHCRRRYDDRDRACRRGIYQARAFDTSLTGCECRGRCSVASMPLPYQSLCRPFDSMSRRPAGVKMISAKDRPRVLEPRRGNRRTLISEAIDTVGAEGSRRGRGRQDQRIQPLNTWKGWPSTRVSSVRTS